MRPNKQNASRRPDRPAKRALQLSKEVIRSLNPDDLSQVNGGCPWASTPGTEVQGISKVCP